MTVARGEKRRREEQKERRGAGRVAGRLGTRSRQTTSVATKAKMQKKEKQPVRFELGVSRDSYTTLKDAYLRLKGKVSG